MRSVYFVNIPGFYIEILRLKNKTLSKRPVALVSQCVKHAYLRNISEEAREAGLEKGMFLDRARRICKDLTILPLDSKEEHKAFKPLQKWIAGYTPSWESLKPGHLFSDLTGTSRLWGSPSEVIHRMQTELSQTFGLPSRIAEASNKMVARIAAKSMPLNTTTVIETGHESRFLAPLKACVLPIVHSGPCHQTLQDLNIQYIREIQNMKTHQLFPVLGSLTHRLKQEAQGIDPSPVFSPQKQPEISRSAFMEPATNDDKKLLQTLRQLLEESLIRLRYLKQKTKSIKLIVIYSDGVQHEATFSLKESTFWEVDLFPQYVKLFEKACQRRVSVKALNIILSQLEHTPAGQEVMNLFIHENRKRDRLLKLYHSLDHIRLRFGMQAVRTGML